MRPMWHESHPVTDLEGICTEHCASNTTSVEKYDQTYFSLNSGSFSGLRQTVNMGTISESNVPTTGPAFNSSVLNNNLDEE